MTGGEKKGTQLISLSHSPDRGYEFTVASAFILLGLFLRVARYASNRSLWLDEILLANNLTTRTFATLTHPLDYRQGAPILFLWIEKTFVTLFGPCELSLRAWPLIAGCLSLPLIYLVGKRAIGPWPAAFATATFALLEPAIYYSSEVKQYSTDALVTLLILHSALRFRDTQDWKPLALVGVVSLYLSHPAILTLAAITLTLFYQLKPARKQLSLLAALWLLAFLPDYRLFLRPLRSDPGLHDYWQSAYMPWSRTATAWVPSALLNLFSDYATMWLRFPLLGIAIAFFGWAELHLARRRGAALLLSAPLLISLLAAALHLYPFSGRLILFLVPTAALLMAGLLADPRKLRWTTPLALLFLATLLPKPFLHLLHPPGREELRDVLSELSHELRADQTLYIYYGANAAYHYYAPHSHLPPTQVIYGRNRDEDFTAFEKDTTDLLHRPGPTWLLFSHTPDGTPRDPRLTTLLSSKATLLKSIESPGAGAYLYDMSSSR